ncbi:MAG: winged helix-turn-helix transcriptional regulator [Tepidiformaceae bacterium]
MTRTYRGQETCPVARTLDVIGQRWTVLIVRDLGGGKTRYSELLESLPGIPSNLLSERLKQLEADGIVTRSFYSEHPPRAAYALTEKGTALGRVLVAMYRWGTDWEPVEDRTPVVTPA